MTARNCRQSRNSSTRGLRGAGAACVIALGCTALTAHAADLSLLTKAPPLMPDAGAGDGPFIDNWMAMATATQAAQPRWMTPLATVTPRLEQEIRYDEFFMNQGNGSRIINSDGGKGLEIIPSYNTELILGVPPYDQLTTAAGKTTSGWGDWPSFLFKYRLWSANEEQGNYVVTAFLQMSAPTGFAAITNDVYVLQPTLAFGKGWGDFDFQATVSQQYAVDEIVPGARANFGNPFLANLALQYHFLQYFWPEFEFNYTYWPGGTHRDLSQLLLTPGLILGRFSLGGRNNLIVGAGYQFAVTDNPVTKNNWVVSTRLTF